MPTYEYECQKCGIHFDVFQRITDPPRKRCGTCRGAVRRLIGSGAGLLFKGNGFYITDYRSDSYRKAANKDTAKPESGKKATDGTGSPNKKEKGAATS